MINSTVTSTPTLGEGNLACRIANKFYKTKNEHQTQDYSWKIRNLEERVEYLEFALHEVLAILDTQPTQSVDKECV